MKRLIKWDQISIVNVLVFSSFIFIGFFILSFTKAGIIANSDEALHHYPNVENFSQHGLGAMFNERYSAANTPLPYILVALLGKLFSPSLLLARVLTCLISLWCVYFALRILKLSGAPAYYALVIIFYPYFLNNSFVFYVINYGLFFVMWSFYVLKKTETSAGYFSDLLVGVLLSLAVLCQQFYLIIPAAIVFYRFIWLIGNRSGLNSASFGQWMLRSFLLTIPLALPSALFFNWGGLTHPNFKFHSLFFHPSTLVAILIVTGFYLFFYLWQAYRSLRLTDVLIAGVLTVVMVTFFRPVFSDQQGPGLFAGIALHIITLTVEVADFLPIVAMTLACFIGILIIIALCRTILSGWDVLLLLSAGLLALGYASNTKMGERYLLGLVILLLLVILPRFKKPFIVWQCMWMAFIGVGYFFYWTFFKFH